MALVTIKKNRPVVNKVDSFCELIRGYDVSKINFTELFNDFDASIKKDHKVTDSALSNVHGDWYEYLISINFNNYAIANDIEFIALPLPNITSFYIYDLYINKLQNYVRDLKKTLQESANVSLITSNPDFVVIRKSVFNKHLRILKYNKKDIDYINALYQDAVGKCKLDDIKCFFGVKNTVRPDRRLQFAHEGSLIKAIYAHMQTRDWLINPIGIKYYALATSFNDADSIALKTVATHSIVTVHDTPRCAVDGIFAVNNEKACQKAASSILN